MFAGDTEKLEALVRGMENVSLNWFTVLPQELATRTTDLVEDCFLRQRDPYEAPWTPSLRALGIRAERRSTGIYKLTAGSNIGLGLTLIKSLKLMLSIRTEAATGQFSVRSDLPYANAMNNWYSGNKPEWKRNVPQPRSFLPRDGVLGTLWHEAWSETSDRLLTQMIAGER